MRRFFRIGVGALSSLVLTGCTIEDLKEGMYETFYQRQCIAEERIRYCDPEHQSYADYKKRREALMKRDKPKPTEGG
jgi:hypothetical protein